MFVEEESEEEKTVDEYLADSAFNQSSRVEIIREEECNDIRAEDTIILLDYDDTLLPSSWLALHQLGLNTPDEVVAEHVEELRVIEACAAKLLTKAIELGDVHLVTNAEEGWIQYTVEKFMPALLPLLPHMTLISARTTFERFSPTSPRTWKIMAFRQQVNQSVAATSSCSCENFRDTDYNVDTIDFYTGDRGACEYCDASRKLNIISLGDSQHEREALRVVAAEFPNVFAKTVKFVERPSLAALQKQMELMHSCLKHICEYEGDLDLLLSQVIDQEMSFLNQGIWKH